MTLVGAFVGVAVQQAPRKAEVGCGGVISCSCGHRACPRDENGKVITRHFMEAVHLLASRGYTCPKCGLYMKGMVVSAKTLKSWKERFPDWDWPSLDIQAKTGRK
jgi:hypothetical protein